MHYDICIMCTIRIQMRVLQQFVQSGNCRKAPNLQPAVTMWKKGNVCNSNPNAGLATICAVWQLWENAQFTAGCDNVKLQSEAKEEVCWVYWNDLKWKVKVLQRQAKTAVLTLLACWPHSINNSAHSHCPGLALAGRLPHRRHKTYSICGTLI